MKLSRNRIFLIATAALFLFATTAESQTVTEKTKDLKLAKAEKVPRKPKKPRRFPVGCMNVGFEYHNNNLLLKPFVVEQNATIYFIHNISQRRIHLESIKNSDDLYAITYATTIDPNRWAVFAFDFEQIPFTCNTGSVESGLTPIDCSTALDICQYPCVVFGEHNGGNYFVSANRSKDESIYMANRGAGILLKSCPKSVMDSVQPLVPDPNATPNPTTTQPVQGASSPAQNNQTQ